MRNNRLGCLSGTGILAAIITSLIIVGYVYARGGLLYNPGPLNAQSGEMLGGVTSHAETGGDCQACHTAPWERATMADRCAECHGAIAIQMQDVASLHGRMLHDNPGLECRHCHPEHRGADVPLTEMTDASFPHEAVGFSLEGHAFTSTNDPFPCDDCHRGDISTFDVLVCRDCHADLEPAFALGHSIEFGDACLACHDGVDRFGKKFVHVSEFALSGGHSGLTCSQCHTDARTLADFENASLDCYSCHRRDDPHAREFGTDCAVCHNPTNWEDATFDHNLAVFKLEGKHAEIRCEECHTNNVFKGTPTDCFACHQGDDEHGGRFGTDCAACHTPDDWGNATFDHNQSNFPLTGRHAALTCEQCHVNSQFAGLSTSCAACHGDPVYHAGMFGTDCASCHSTDNWFAVYRGPHPSIADEGGSGVNHGNTSCRTCHTQTLSSATCLSCHDSNNPDGEGEGGGEGGDD